MINISANSELLTTSSTVTTTTSTTAQPVTLNYDALFTYRTKTPHFSGYFNVNGNKFYITRVIYSDPATIVFWSDDTKTIAKCHGEDVYSPETGLSICILKKLIGTNSVRELYNDWVMYGNSFVTIKDVRAKHR